MIGAEAMTLGGLKFNTKDLNDPYFEAQSCQERKLDLLPQSIDLLKT